MSKWYGSLTNRIEEGCQFAKEITVGMGMTEYLWSDRHAYEVVDVKDQEHVFVRQYRAIRIDNNGMSECQEYKFEHNEDAPIFELEKRKGCWYKVNRYLKSEIMKLAQKRFDNRENDMISLEKEFYWLMGGCNFTEKQWEKFNNGKEIKKYIKWNNISFGVASEYYDYSF